MLSDDQSLTAGDAHLEALPDTLDAVAVQLAEAACSAWNRDLDTARTAISRALILLGKEFNPASAPPRQPGNGVRRIPRGGLPAWQAHRLVAHIDSHLAERISCSELAAITGLSYSHFCRVFKETFGSTVQKYLTRRRVEFAQGVMLKTQLPLSEIALTCGMSDQAHFTRVFRRVVGQTPHAWRRAWVTVPPTRIHRCAGAAKGTEL
jgi:AraC-like DNA-binding protein